MVSKGLVLNIGTEDLTGEPILILPYLYQVSVLYNGRFRIMITSLGKNPFYIAGDKRKKHVSSELLAQIESVVRTNAPNNSRIREVIDKYWPVDTNKSKRLRKNKAFDRWMASESSD